MPWSSHIRTGYEAALLRAYRELERAREHSITAGDEYALEAVVQAERDITMLRHRSLEDRSAKRPQQMSGQLTHDLLKQTEDRNV